MVLVSDEEVDGRNYKELKPISDVDKEYSDDHQSNSQILQCDNDEASVKSEESYSEESLNLGKVFETSNENAFLIGHSSRLGGSAKFNRSYTDFMNIYFEDIFCESCTSPNYETPNNNYFKVSK